MFPFGLHAMPRWKSSGQQSQRLPTVSHSMVRQRANGIMGISSDDLVASEAVSEGAFNEGSLDVLVESGRYIPARTRILVERATIEEPHALRHIPVHHWIDLVDDRIPDTMARDA